MFYKPDDVREGEFGPDDIIDDLEAELAFVAAHHREETEKAKNAPSVSSILKQLKMKMRRRPILRQLRGYRRGYSVLS